MLAATRYVRYNSNSFVFSNLIESGISIVVVEVTASAGSVPASVSLTDRAGATIARLFLKANTTEKIDTPWLAKNGLNVGMSFAGDIDVTVKYTYTGA